MNREARNLIANFKSAKPVKSRKKHEVIITDKEYQLFKEEMKEYNLKSKVSKKGQKKPTPEKARIIYIGKHHS